jgi:glycosyltransferase involved in cell wall biosynthesis
MGESPQHDPEHDFISIIMPVYNKASYVEAAITSVRQQTFLRWELVVIEDASTDESADLLKNLDGLDSRIRIIYNLVNKGGNASRNIGLQNCKGDYVMFFDADDLLTSNCLADRMEKMKAKPVADMWIFPMGVLTGQGHLQSSALWDLKGSSDFLIRFLQHDLPWAICQPIWSKYFLLNLDGFDLSFQRMQDVELHTRALMAGARVNVFPEMTPGVYYRTEEERVDNQELFYRKFSSAAIQYYNKYYPLVTSGIHRKALSKTLLQVIALITYQRRIRKVSKEMAATYINELVQTCALLRHRRTLRWYAFLDRMSPVHPKGLKFFISKILF